MSLFGKKKEGKKGTVCVCACGGGTSDGAESAASSVCRGEKKGGISCIKVLGSGCKSCQALYENARAAVGAVGMQVEIEYITDLRIVMEYGVMSMPALVINEQVVSMGKVLKPNEIVQLIKES